MPGTVCKQTRVTKKIYRDGLAFVRLTRMVPAELVDDEKFKSMLFTPKASGPRCGGMPKSWPRVRETHRRSITRHPMIEKARKLKADGWLICGILDAGDEDRLAYGAIAMRADYDDHEYCRILPSGVIRKIKI